MSPHFNICIGSLILPIHTFILFKSTRTCVDICICFSVFERKKAFEEFMADGQQSFLDAEKHILGFDHPEIGSEACKSWQVPPALSTAIRYHHHPSQSKKDTLAYIVHIADVLAMMAGLGLGVDGLHYRMDAEALEFLNLNEKDVTGIISELVESVQEISE